VTNNFWLQFVVLHFKDLLTDACSVSADFMSSFLTYIHYITSASFAHHEST